MPMTLWTRRRILTALGAVGAAAVAPRRAIGQTQGPPGPPSTVTNPPRDFGPNAPPTTYFTDPDVLTVDPAFGNLLQANSAIKRLWTGALWAEWPAWRAHGRNLVWRDNPHNRQMLSVRAH